MIKLARLFSAAAGAACLATTTPAQTPGQLVHVRSQDPDLSRNPRERLIIHDLVILAGKPLALVSDRGRPRSQVTFYHVGTSLGDCSVKEITPEHMVLVERGGKKEMELKPAAADPSAPSRFSKEWILSESNPMLQHPTLPPREFYDNWELLTPAEVQELGDFYRKYGWQLQVAIIAGALDVTWDRTNDAERLAAAHESRAVFLALLTAGQRQTWDQLRSNQPIYADANGKMTAEQQQLGAERRRIFAEFQASLTPEQRDAFSRMNALPVTDSREERPKSDFVLPQLLPEKSDDPFAPPRYSKAWIDSPANPMRKRHAWPRELVDLWSTLSTAEKTQVLVYFQKHGWQAIHVETVSGNTSSMAWKNIYAEEREAARRAKSEAFTASLSPHQLRAWRTGILGPAIYIANGKPDYAKNRNTPAQQRFFEEFWAGLSTDQKAAYTAKHDAANIDRE